MNFTPRQVMLVNLLAKGYTRPAIAAHLGHKYCGIYTQLARIKKRLGVRSDAAMIVRIQALRLPEDPSKLPPVVRPEFDPLITRSKYKGFRGRLKLPVVGYVYVRRDSREECRMCLWLISRAVKLLAHQSGHPFSEWSEADWRQTLHTMNLIMNPPTPA